MVWTWENRDMFVEIDRPGQCSLEKDCWWKSLPPTVFLKTTLTWMIDFHKLYEVLKTKSFRNPFWNYCMFLRWLTIHQPNRKKAIWLMNYFFLQLLYMYFSQYWLDIPTSQWSRGLLCSVRDLVFNSHFGITLLPK